MSALLRTTPSLAAALDGRNAESPDRGPICRSTISSSMMPRWTCSNRVWTDESGKGANSNPRGPWCETLTPAIAFYDPHRRGQPTEYSLFVLDLLWVLMQGLKKNTQRAACLII
jgi:hypothetical protein